MLSTRLRKIAAVVGGELPPKIKACIRNLHDRVFRKDLTNREFITEMNDAFERTGISFYLRPYSKFSMVVTADLYSANPIDISLYMNDSIDLSHYVGNVIAEVTYVLIHEFTHLHQESRMNVPLKPLPYDIPGHQYEPSEKEVALHEVGVPEELMAIASSTVAELADTFSKKQLIKFLKDGSFKNRVRTLGGLQHYLPLLKDSEARYHRFLKYCYMYVQKLPDD